MKELVKDIAIALVIVLIITAVIKPTIVNGESMEPTLQSGDYLIVNKLAYKIGEPEYGDVIVFESELEKDDSSGKKMLIKRVIGTAGDIIKIDDGSVFRNGELLDESYTLDGYTSGNPDEWVIPEGSVFVLGDNRQNSRDSRDPEVGTVSIDTIMGKAFVRLYPFNNISGI